MTEQLNLKLTEPLLIAEHKWTDDTIPVLSVFSWVYNHRDFIRESIESILMQKTEFKVEIIIHDDASNDGTAEIIKEYEVKYPKLFNNKLQKENQWSQGKSVMTALFEKPRGRFIALTHGDDYWTDPLKLQKQVDFLEANEEYSLCGHSVKNLNNNIFTKQVNTKTDINTLDIIENGPLMATCSILMRNNLTSENNNFLFSSNLGDWAIVFLHSKNGKIKLLNDYMAVYRLHENGVYSKKTNLYKIKQNIDFQLNIINYFPEYKNQIHKYIDKKKKYHNLYNYSFSSFLKGETSFLIFLYGIRVKLSLKKRLVKFFNKSI